MKNKLEPEEVIKLKLVIDQDKELVENKKEAFLYGLAGGMCFDFNKFNDHLFLVGTEEGKIHLCSKAYSGQYLETYEGHYLAVYAVKWNTFHPRVFISCSADWTIKLWDQNIGRPIMTFDLGCAVGDIEWAPYSSTGNFNNFTNLYSFCCRYISRKSLCIRLEAGEAPPFVRTSRYEESKGTPRFLQQGRPNHPSWRRERWC